MCVGVWGYRMDNWVRGNGDIGWMIECVWKVCKFDVFLTLGGFMEV